MLPPYLFLINLGNGQSGLVAISDAVTDLSGFRAIDGRPRPGTLAPWYNTIAMLSDPAFARVLVREFEGSNGVHFGRIVLDFGRPIGWDREQNDRMVHRLLLNVTNVGYSVEGAIRRWDCELLDARPFNPTVIIPEPAQLDDRLSTRPDEQVSELTF